MTDALRCPSSRSAGARVGYQKGFLRTGTAADVSPGSGIPFKKTNSRNQSK
jgi:hypothetical protein